MNKIKENTNQSDAGDNNPGGVIILENSPVGESQSNGSVERALKEVQHQVRKLKLQLEENIGEPLNNESPVWPWLIQYAAQVIHTFKVHKEDNRTSGQRIRADPTVPDIPKFAEHIYFKPAKTASMPKDEPRWRTGIWLGFLDHSNENIIGTSKGVLKCRAIRRYDQSEQFNVLIIEKMLGTPWKPVPGRNSMKIPTNIEENGTVVDESGNIDGYVEEN